MSPKSLINSVQHELIIKKSRFIGFIYPVQNVVEVKDKISQIRKQYYDSRHVCVAWSCEGQTGLDDDGEPSGTAAKPMYQVMQHKQVSNFLAIVVRYFGGIKLGAGGLVRAYSGVISEAMTNAELNEIRQKSQISFSFDYGLENSIRRLVDELNGDILSTIYDSQCHFTISLDEDMSAHFKSKLDDLSLGSALIQEDL